jgi:hypothetical protein
MPRTSVDERLADLRRLVRAARDYHGAVPLALWMVKGLRTMYRQNPARFAPAVIQAIRDLKAQLPPSVDLVPCPACYGSGTQRWGMYKHGCNRCGGFKRVARTAEAVRENERTWS